MKILTLNSVSLTKSVIWSLKIRAYFYFLVAGESYYGFEKFFDEKLHQKLFLTIDYYYQYVVFLGGNLLQMLIGMRHFGKFLHLYY